MAAGLKSVGDSKSPLKFLAFSAILNAILDLIFLGVFGFGIMCSAVTTVIAEAVSALLAGGFMILKASELCPPKNQWRINRPLLGQIRYYSGPTALQQAVTRVDDFACIPEQGIATAISTYIAQNRGAEKKERIRSGFHAGMWLEVYY